jgi:hypothetical protein
MTLLNFLCKMINWAIKRDIEADLFFIVIETDKIAYIQRAPTFKIICMMERAKYHFIKIGMKFHYSLPGEFNSIIFINNSWLIIRCLISQT